VYHQLFLDLGLVVGNRFDAERQILRSFLRAAAFSLFAENLEFAARQGTQHAVASF
jgi:hypothetical protein